jgi:hypothetical protein
VRNFGGEGADVMRRDQPPQVGQGQRSTLNSYGTEENGKQLLIPGVSDDKNPRVLTFPQAAAEYERTGKHLGEYDTQENSDNAGTLYHLDHSKDIGGAIPRPPTMISPPAQIAMPTPAEPAQRQFTPITPASLRATLSDQNPAPAVNELPVISKPSALNAPAPSMPAPAVLPKEQTPLEKKTAEDQAKLATLQGSKSGVDQLAQKPGFWHKVGAVAAKVGDVALSSTFPNVAAQIPGTQLHHDMLVKKQGGMVTGDLGQQKAQSDIAKEKAEANAKDTDKEPKGIAPGSYIPDSNAPGGYRQVGAKDVTPHAIAPGSFIPDANAPGGYRQIGEKKPDEGETLEGRTKVADAIGLTGQDRKLYLANGKVPEGMTEYQRRRLAQEEEKLNKPHIATPAQFANVDARKATAEAKLKDFHYVPASTGKDSSVQPAYYENPKANETLTEDELTDRKQAIQDAYEQELTSLGGTPKHLDYRNPAPVQVPKPPPATVQPVKIVAPRTTQVPVRTPVAPVNKDFPLQSLGGHKVGDVVKLKNGGNGRITGFNSKGQFSYDPVQ